MDYTNEVTTKQQLEIRLKDLFKWHYKIFCVNKKYGIQVRISYFLFTQTCQMKKIMKEKIK